jgi:hypothetical protein
MPGFLVGKSRKRSIGKSTQYPRFFSEPCRELKPTATGSSWQRLGPNYSYAKLIFSFYFQGRGNRAGASTLVITDNESDRVFSGG